MSAAIVLTACCATLSYFTFRRSRDKLLAFVLGVLLFVAFLAGSLLHPVGVTEKRLSHESSIAEHASGGQALGPLDQHSLENLPNITLPAIGNIDVVGVKRGDRFSTSRAPSLRAGEALELRGWVADPVAHDKAGGLFVIVNDSSRINVSTDYGIDRPDVAATLKNPQLENTGFDVTIPASALRPGNDEVQLGAIAADQRGFFKFPDRVTVQVNER